MTTAEPDLATAPGTAAALRRWLPVLAVLGLVLLAYAGGVGRYVSLAAIAEHRNALKGFVAAHPLAAVAIYTGVFVTGVALSLPGATLLGIAGGFLFGWAISVPVSVAAATVGGLVIFRIVKTSFGAALARRGGPFVRRLSGGFAADAFSYLLFLRLVPVFPSFAVNAVAGLCNIRTATFAAATFIGIIPVTAVRARLGMGLDGVIDAQMAAHRACLADQGAAACEFAFDPSALAGNDLIFALAALGLLALVPVLHRRWKKR